jgi:hypothetical protein
MRFVFESSGVATTTAKPADWAAVKAEILARLDVAAEYEALGVRFSKPAPGPNGLRECHAIDRPDDAPSAFVNISTGVYHDSGGEGATLNLFDFALKHTGDRFGRWIDAAKHFAGRAGVDLAGLPKPGKEGRVREATYLYRLADGSTSYAVFRYRLPNGKKAFTQHPPDGRGGWKYGPGCMEGVGPLPYRLPELLASDPAEEPVWVVEGEKDADRLATDLGLVATTNHQGAQSTDATWPKFKHHFAGREVYILPDNDPGGLAHARRVAGHLTGVARLVKVVPLPGLPPKGDVSDWLDRGHTEDELGRLAAAAPIWSPDAAEPSGPEPSVDPDRARAMALEP